MTGLLPTTLLTLLIASPLLILLAYVGIGSWREASDRVDEALRIPGSDDQLCHLCTQRVATQPDPKAPDRSLCMECLVNRDGPPMVPGGVESQCMTPKCLGIAKHAHPDGGSGGVCDTCEEALR